MRRRIALLLLTCLVASLWYSGSAAADRASQTSSIGSFTVFTNDDTTNAGYSRIGAASYARKWAPWPGNPAYHNYADEGGAAGGDCTNFVAQALRGGNMGWAGCTAPPCTYEQSDDRGISWYYFGADRPDRSTTWTGAHESRYFWGVVNGAGGKHAYQMRKYSIDEAIAHYAEIYSDLWPGDVVQYTNASGATTHSQIVYRYFRDRNFQPVMWMAQHSDASDILHTWRYDVALKEYLIHRKAIGSAWVTTLKMKLAAQ